MVPSLNSSANKRIVINGKIKTKANQKNTELKKASDCVLHLALVHERDLEIKIDPADDQKKDHHDVRDRGVKIAAHFAGEQGIKLTHRSLSVLSLISNQIRMGQLDEDIFERSAALSKFAHGPVAFNGEPENLFAHVCT